MAAPNIPTQPPPSPEESPSPAGSFRPDPILRWLQQYSVRRVWVLVAVVHLAIYFLTGLLVEVRHHGEQYQSIFELAELMNGFGVWVVFVPTMWAYYRWLPVASLAMARKLQEQGVIGPVTSDQVSISLSDVIGEALSARWTYVVSLLAITLSIFVAFAIFIPIQNTSLGRVNFWYYTAESRAVFLVQCAINCWVIFLLIARAIAIARALDQYFRTRNCIRKLVPYHADGCAGMGPVGDLAVRVVYIAVILAGWIVLLGAVYPALSGGSTNWAIMAALFAIYLMALSVSLYALLWRPHSAMQDYKDARIGRASEPVLVLQDKMAELLQESDLSNLELLADHARKIDRDQSGFGIYGSPDSNMADLAVISAKIRRSG